MKMQSTPQRHFSQRHVRQGFSAHAHQYDTHAQLQQSVLFNALRELEPHFVPDMRLLDAGCGTGYLVELLRYNEVPFEVFGCDMALGMCREARERYSELHPQHIACGDITALPFADASCDMAVSSLTLQWVHEPQQALQELHRVLADGGRAMLTTFGPMTLQELRESFAVADKLPHVSDFPLGEELQKTAEAAGFVVENFSTEFRTQHYASVRDLMQAIRAIGASNKASSRRKTLTGRHRFAAMEAAYRDAYETARGIPASWEVLYFSLRKAG